MCTRSFPYIDRTDETLFENVEIITENDEHPVVVQRLFLIYSSEKLRQLVNEEARNNQICVPNISKTIMELLVNYVYSTYSENPSMIDINEENILEISKSSKYLQLFDVVNMCRSWMDTIETKSENCALLLQCALILYREDDEQHYVKKILDFLVKNICEVSLTDSFCSFPLSLIKHILEYNRNFIAVSEKTMAVAIVNWLKNGRKKSYSVNVELVKEFTLRENQITILTAFFEQGDNEERTAAFQTLRALYLEDPVVKTESSDNFSSASSASSGYKSTTPIKQEQEDEDEGDSNSTHSLAKRQRLNSTSPSNCDQVNNTEDDITNNGAQDSLNFDFAEETPPFPSTSSKVQVNIKNSSKKRDVAIIYFLHGDINIVGSGRQLWSYNLCTQQFKRVVNLQPPLSSLRKLSLLYWNGRVYFLGGENAYTGVVTSSVFVLKLKTKTWKKKEFKMIYPRYDFQSVIFDQCIYAVGGNQEDPISPELPGIAMNLVEKCSLSGKRLKFEEATDYLNKPRANAGVVVLDGKMYAIAGLSPMSEKDAAASSECECFDPSLPVDNQWTYISKMNIPRIGLAAVVCNGHIYAIGGRASETENIGLRCVEIYNPETKQWTQGPNLVNGRHSFAAVFHDGNILVFGGDSQGDIPTIEKLDLQSNTWEIVGDMDLYGDCSSIAFQQHTGGRS